jgi:serine/threonine protein kinase
MAGLEGTRLGAYELVERIGGGGMAEVYRAKQSTAFGREVAIKVIRAGHNEDPSFRERFLREAQAISKLSHPNILPLIEFGEEQNILYLVMPLAREGTLRDLLKQHNGPLSLEEAVPLFVQLCDAVQYAHEEGIIHRDIKPQNVLLQRRTHVLLADFGIARDAAETQMTSTGAGIGTVEYMAPEQAIGQADKRSDIYSLGIVLYQLLTGSVPYSGSTPFQILMRHTNDALPDPRLLNPTLPGEIVQVLQGALTKDPQRRFQSAQALGRAVQQVRPDATPESAQRPGANQPPISVAPPPRGTFTKQTTWHGQDFRDAPVEPGAPEYPSGPTPTGPGGFTNAPTGRQGPPSGPPRGWANAPQEADSYDQPTWNTQSGRGGVTGAGWQARGPIAQPPYAGGGQYPPQPIPRRSRRPLVIALIAALVLAVVLASAGVAYGLGLFNSNTGTQITQQSTATTAPQPTATPTATATATATPSPTPTDTPTPTPTPTATPIFKVTSISATVSPNNWASPCGASQLFTFNATIHVNTAPGDRNVTYYWTRSDGASSPPITVMVPASDTSVVVTPDTWMLFSGVPNGTYWERVVITTPNSISSNKATFTINC